MTDSAFTPSPCIRKCGLNEQEICRGCFRTIDEIIGWQAMSEADKQQTVANCRQRRQQRSASQRAK